MAMQPLSALDSEKRSNLGKVGLKLFFSLSERWELTQDQQLKLLGLSSRSTLHGYKKKVRNNEPVKLDVDALERLSLIAGIRKAVEVLYPKQRWDSYMNTPNREFGGASAKDMMLQGSMKSLYIVREYLDASRGGHFG